MFLANWSNGSYVFFSIVAILITAALIVLMYFRFSKERRQFKEENISYIEGVQSKSEITSTINSYLNKISNDTPFYLIYVDLDKYTNIVNAFGEKESRKIIEALIANFNKMISYQIQIGRMGTDCFLFFLKTHYERNEVISAANKICEAIRQPIRVYGDTYANLTGSVSVVSFPRHGMTFKQLMDSIKIANYICKKDGGDRVTIYSDEMSQKEGENVQYYMQVKEAIANHQFTLYYQPIIDIEKKEIFGAEALLRWNHPEFGLLSPFKFINILEQSGDINWIGIWGLEAMCQYYLDLKRIFPLREFRLSINLSPKQLMNDKLPVDYQKILKKYRISAKSLIIEMEEFLIFEQHPVIHENILKLKELGFGLAVDGFALDHSTLNKLQKLPIDIIKLDRTFLSDESNSYIQEKFSELLVDLAHNNNMLVIAEGAENYEMIEYVRKHKISTVQGYYFSKPVSSEDFIEYIKNEKIIKIKCNPIDQTPKQKQTTKPIEEAKTVDVSENNEVIQKNPETKTKKKPPLVKPVLDEPKVDIPEVNNNPVKVEENKK